MAKIYEVYGNDAHQMTMQLMEKANVAAMLPTHAHVALKPNLVLAASPEDGATTHGGVLSGAIEYLRANGVTQISVIEGSWVGDETIRAREVAGYDEILWKYDVPFYDLKRDQTRTVKTPIRDMEICERALSADFLINLPVLKGHCQTAMTCALKNLKGCIPDKEKRRFHTEGLMRPIAALASVLRPHLTIVDSICGDLNFEEGGTPIRTNRMLLGTDPVQIDAYGCQLMGLPLQEVPYIQLAEQFGAGSTAISKEDIVFINTPSQAATYPKPTGRVAQLTKNVQADSACSACFANLVRAIYKTNSRAPIAIGQGFREKKIAGIGIGQCCKGADICVQGCPPTAEAIAQTLKGK